MQKKLNQIYTQIDKLQSPLSLYFSNIENIINSNKFYQCFLFCVNQKI